MILTFFIIWGNYQSRYILAALPILMILGAGLFVRLLDGAGEMPHMAGRILLRAFLLMGFFMAMQKIYFVNIHLSFPHDFCYF
jgi:hypothetical protein